MEGMRYAWFNVVSLYTTPPKLPLFSMHSLHRYRETDTQITFHQALTRAWIKTDIDYDIVTEEERVQAINQPYLICLKYVRDQVYVGICFRV
jgi:hypothetical protein